MSRRVTGKGFLGPSGKSNFETIGVVVDGFEHDIEVIADFGEAISYVAALTGDWTTLTLRFASCGPVAQDWLKPFEQSVEVGGVAFDAGAKPCELGRDCSLGAWFKFPGRYWS
jgi:hypothetical protein